MNEYPT